MPNRSPATIAAMLVLLMTAPVAQSGGGAFPSYSFTLGEGDWAAWRFNVTPDNDLHFIGSFQWCNAYRDTIAHTEWSITDGEPWYIGLTPDRSSPLSVATRGRLVSAGVEGHSVSLVDEWNGLVGPYCTDGWRNKNWTPLPAERSFTLILMNDGPMAWWNVSAAWTRGVIENDVTRGRGTVLTYDKFDHGVHASLEAPVTLGAGAALSSRANPTRDFIGLFSPNDAYNSHYARPSCSKDDGPCRPADPYDATILLDSKGPTRWRVATDYEAGDGPAWPALWLLDLPDDSFLSDT